MSVPSDRARYVIALGSNRCGRHGRPVAEVRAALAALGQGIAASRIIETAPLGPSIRRFANAAAVIASDEAPPVLLARLKAIERAFGRRRGKRWGARVIDLDIILWSGGAWSSAGLTVPHTGFRKRAFVLGPLSDIVPRWRDPLTGKTVRQLACLAARRKPCG
ncbi:MAG: 2-amino-4-hydroxy-6-hydroxymethyldihydropteridine diphosphokinase [Sphingomonas sp.]